MTKKQEILALLIVLSLLFMPFICVGLHIKDIIVFMLIIPFWFLNSFLYIIFKKHLIKAPSNFKMFTNNFLWSQIISSSYLILMIFPKQKDIHWISITLVFGSLFIVCNIIFSILVVIIINAVKKLLKK